MAAMTLLGTLAAAGWFVALALPLGGAGYLQAVWSGLRRGLRAKTSYKVAPRLRRAWPQRVGTSGFIV
jgi:hypothetical protein